MAWMLDEQAVETVKLGPLTPTAKAIIPEAEFRVMVRIKPAYPVAT
jgi:hypothetical protein